MRSVLAALVIASHVPAHWHPPSWWLRQATCIHEHEGAWTANTGNGYYGGFQFLLSTWVHAGGRGLPSVATPREQLFRAYVVYRRDGSWSEWHNTARSCGLR